MTHAVALGEVAVALQDGPFGSNLKSSHYVDEGVRVIRLQNIGLGQFDDRDQAFVSTEHFARLRKHECLPGDVLIATLGDPIIRACLQPKWLVVALNKADCLRLRCDPRHVIPEYVAHFLNSAEARAQAIKLAHGQTRPRVNLSQVRTLRIPLPSLDEQRRIAGILDLAWSVRQRQSKALAMSARLSLSRFEQMFGMDASDGRWDRVPVSAFVISFSGGKSFAGSDDDDHGATNRVLRVSAVTSGEFRPEESRPVPREYHPPAHHFVEQGDLLISRANTSELVGAVALVDSCPSGILLPDKIWRFVWNDPETAVPEYVWQLFRTTQVRRSVQRRATGTSGSMKNISAEKLMGIEVPWPPLSIRRDFALFYRAVQPLRRRISSHLNETDELVRSLQARAFTGEL